MAPRRIAIHQVDVFTRTPLTGNPAAVVPAADGLTPDIMQAVAREMNLSETAFVFSANAQGEIPVRFFTPTREVPLCGHATLGAHYVRARLAGEEAGKVAQRSPGGLWHIEWRTEEEATFVQMLQGPIRMGPVLPDSLIERLVAALGLEKSDLKESWPVQIVSTGHAKVMVPVTGAEALMRAAPRMDELAELSKDAGADGYFVFAMTEGEDFATRARMFGPALGIPEDPVNGSGHGPLAAYLGERPAPARDLPARGFWSAMGDHLGRPGRLWVHRASPDAVEVGGFVTPVFEASVTVNVS